MTSASLIYAQKPDLKALLEVECKSLSGYTPAVYSSLEELESMMDVVGEVSVLIMEYENTPAFKNFVDIIQLKDGLKHILVIGDKARTDKKVRYFPLTEYESLQNILKEIFVGKMSNIEAWVSVPVEAFLHFKKLPFDLYVKISETKYVKRIPAHEVVEEAIIAKFKSKGLGELYFDKRFKRDFSLMLINNMINRVEHEYEDVNESLKARSEVYSTVKEIVHGMGLAPRVVEVCETMIQEIEKDAIKHSKEISQHLERLKNRPDLTFQYRFIEMTCYIGGQLLQVIDPSNWESELKRFSFAAFFCDMTLSDPQLIHVFTMEQFDQLRPAQQKEVHDHALRAANLVAKLPNAPIDVGIVIKQHHGSLSGVGLLHKKSIHLATLAKCLIISQELAYGVLTNTHKPSLEVLKGLIKVDRGAALQELVEAFENSLRPELLTA